MFKKAVLAATVFVAALFAMIPAAANAADFCWASSHGRGVGTLPTACTGGRNIETGMCYVPCNAGFQGAVTMCMRNCPSGYVNTGLTCHVDKPLLIGATVDACNLSTSCPGGYTNAGLLCGLNTPAVPAGYKALVSGPAASGLDLSREIYDRGIGLAPSVCPDGLENNGGLCYSKCNANETGVGPVCWSQCPKGWSACGMGCARSANACAQVVVGQVMATGMAAAQTGVLIASLGASAPATEAVSAPRFPVLAAKLAELKKLYKENEELIKLARLEKKLLKAEYKAYELANAVTPEEIAAVAAELVGLFDPTGLTSAGAAYVHPTCDKVGS